MKSDRTAHVREKLARIADEDLSEIIRSRQAVKRMMQLGYTPATLMMLLNANPPPITEGVTVFDEERRKPWMGFDTREQAVVAALSAQCDSERPAVFKDTNKRVEALIKNQVPERAATTIGLAVVSVPAMGASSTDGASIKTFRRMPSGKLKELSPTGQVIDMHEDVESNVMIMKKKPQVAP